MMHLLAGARLAVRTRGSQRERDRRDDAPCQAQLGQSHCCPPGGAWAAAASKAPRPAKNGRRWRTCGPAVRSDAALVGKIAQEPPRPAARGSKPVSSATWAPLIQSPCTPRGLVVSRGASPGMACRRLGTVDDKHILDEEIVRRRAP